MRILLVNDTLYPDSIGGVEKRNHDLALALAARGHEVTLAGFGAVPAALPPNITVVSFGPLGSLYRNGRRSRLHAFRYARRVFGLDVARFDVVETANIPYIHVAALALRCAIAGRPLLVSWYEFWGAYWREYMGGPSAPVYRLAEWLTAQLGDAVLASSGLTASRLAARRRRGGGVPVVGCGVDLEAVRPALEAPVAPGATLLYAGRLIRQKRIDLLLGALALVPHESDASLAIYGEGPERGALEALARELGVAGRVAFHGHVESSEELWRRIRSARIAVQPSAREGFGIFPLEAMALGVPVVYCLSPDSAVGELVRDGIEGLATGPDREALARAIGRLLSDDALRAQLGAAGRLRAREFDLDRIGERMEELISRLAEPSRSARSDRD